VYVLLLDAIVSGKLRPGERFLEKNWRTISTSAVLQSASAVEVASRGNSLCGYKVRAMTAAVVKKIYEIPGILERAAVALVASQLTASVTTKKCV
jgi:DNA-binding GntR family transcriptional regulator